MKNRKTPQMDRSQIPRLKSLTVRARPLTCHALSWSSDAELAVATDEAVHVFIPEFPRACAGEDTGPPSSSSDRDSRGGGAVGAVGAAGPAPQYAIRFQIAGLFKPLYAVNAQLCALAGLNIPPGPDDDDRHMMVDTAAEEDDDDDDDEGGGGDDDGGRSDDAEGEFDLRDNLPSAGRVVTGKGGSLSHVVSASWSPPGMGCNLRPILTALGTAGNIVALGEHYSHEDEDDDNNQGSSGAGAAAAATARDPKNWRVLWGLGAGLPLPAEEEEDQEGNSSAYRTMDERIVAFDWAGEVGPGRGLLGYVTDEGEAVVMSVLQFPARGDDGAVRGFVCRLREVARFDARGPHHLQEDTDASDPEYVPHQSAFCIRWSPWHVAGGGGSRTAMIAYAGKNHVGFRRVTLAEPWEAEKKPVLRVEEADASGMCLFLSADASVHWEDRIWTESNGEVTARGLITTPFDVKPFQVSLSTPGQQRQQQQPPIRPHPTSACSTSYPANPPDDNKTNPITGLVIHPAGALASRPPFPLFTAVRASATSLNNDWYETNLPDPTLANSATAATSRLLPKWVKKISAATARSVPRTRALEGLDPDSSSDSDLDLDMDSGPDGYGSSDAPVEDHESSIMVCPERYGLAGLAQSPGGGCTAVLAARYDTAHPCRRPVFRVLFGRGYGGFSATTTTTTTKNSGAATTASEGVEKGTLTAEGRVWEDIYSKSSAAKHHHHHHHHQGPESAAQGTNGTSPSSHLRALFAPLLERQTCVFCDQRLDGDGFEATCPDGHVFAICTSSGLAILAPGISRVCAVCGRRSLTDRQLRRAARDGTAPPVDSSSFWCSDVCGSCGGKFIA